LLNSSFNTSFVYMVFLKQLFQITFLSLFLPFGNIFGIT
jgi:hypothetical protein